MIRILIADDHVLFRQGLRQLLEAQPDIELAGEAATAAETLVVAEREKPDVVLLDISMPGKGGPETVADLRAAQPTCKILMLTAMAEDYFAVRCLQAGSDGYITKEQPAEELIRAIRHVHRGHKYLSASLADQLAFRVQTEVEGELHQSLSRREFQVMRLIGQGQTPTEIAAALNLSVKTVSTYRRRMLEKMNFRGNAEVMSYAIKEGLV